MIEVEIEHEGEQVTLYVEAYYPIGPTPRWWVSGFNVTDPSLDAPDGATVGLYKRTGGTWEPTELVDRYENEIQEAVVDYFMANRDRGI